MGTMSAGDPSVSPSGASPSHLTRTVSPLSRSQRNQVQINGLSSGVAWSTPRVLESTVVPSRKPATIVQSGTVGSARLSSPRVLPRTTQQSSSLVDSARPCSQIQRVSTCTNARCGSASLLEKHRISQSPRACVSGHAERPLGASLGNSIHRAPTPTRASESRHVERPLAATTSGALQRHPTPPRFAPTGSVVVSERPVSREELVSVGRLMQCESTTPSMAGGDGIDRGRFSILSSPTSKAVATSKDIPTAVVVDYAFEMPEPDPEVSNAQVAAGGQATQLVKPPQAEEVETPGVEGDLS